MSQVPSTDFSRSLPDELQFTCVRSFDEREHELAKALADGPPADRVAAAMKLWNGHSRPNARAVLQILDDLPADTPGLNALKGVVEADLRPAAIVRELRQGDYRWGTWLAFLRPCPDAVPELLAGLTAKPDYRAETVLALGASRDRRALEPLLRQLKGGYQESGDAAQSLGHFGSPAVEDELLKVASAGPGWPQVKACGALARVGTKKALPVLEGIANSTGYTGALDTRGAAMRAVAAIEARERPASQPRPEARPAAVLKGHSDYVWSVAFGPDGKTLASASDDKTVRLWDAETGKQIAALPGHARQMMYVAFALGGRAVAGAGWGGDGAVRVWDAKTGKVLSDGPAGNGGINSLVASADGVLLAASGLDEAGSGPGTVRLLDPATGKALAELPGTTEALAFAPGGKVLATCHRADVQLWVVATRTKTATLSGHTEGVRAGAFSPDGRTLATGGDWTVRTWDVATGRPGLVRRGSSRVSSVSFSPDGRLLAVGEVEGPVRVWDVGTGALAAVVAGRGPVAFSPAGGVLATGSDGKKDVLLWTIPAKR